MSPIAAPVRVAARVASFDRSRLPLPLPEARRPRQGAVRAVFLLVEAIVASLGLAFMVGREVVARRRKGPAYFKIMRDRVTDSEEKPFMASQIDGM